MGISPLAVFTPASRFFVDVVLPFLNLCEYILSSVTQSVSKARVSSAMTPSTNFLKDGKSRKKSCLVTGCSAGGCGAALAEAFSDSGYHVFATARSVGKVPKSLHDRRDVTVLALDVTDSGSIKDVKDAVRGVTGGGLDVLINNAGLGMSKPALDTGMEEARRLMDLNFFAALEMMQAFGPMLVEAKGTVVNNSSVGGYIGFPFTSIYNATKAALTIASDAWRLELAPLGVRVITLITGGIDTKFLANLETVPSLPEDSYYKVIEKDIMKQEEKVPFGVTPESFARDVLKRVESGRSGKYWVGGAAWLSRVTNWFAGEWVSDQVALWQKPFTKKLADCRRLEIEGEKIK